MQQKICKPYFIPKTLTFKTLLKIFSKMIPSILKKAQKTYENLNNPLIINTF